MQSTEANNPVCLLVIGMAGSGKTTFLQQLYSQTVTKDKIKKAPYFINLDPGVLYLPYIAQVDIRKEINYKELMKSHGLGPNGAIMAALNIYSTKFHEVIQEIENNKAESSFFCIDTPGQIEVFTWSASGSIITNAVAHTVPTAIIFIIDSAKCQNPNTFMSNMLFCCSILYKYKLPLIVVFNKCDVFSSDLLIDWMKDYEKFMEAAHKDESYLSTLSHSLCLSLEEFYKDLNFVSVSSISGFGFDKLFDAVEIARKEYFEIFLPDLIAKWNQNKDQLEQKKLNDELKKFETDLKNFNINQDKLSKNFFNKEKGQQFNVFPPSKESNESVEETKQTVKQSNENQEKNVLSSNEFIEKK